MMPIRALRMRKTAVASVLKAVFNSAKKPTVVTYSVGNTIATFGSSSDAICQLEYYRTTGTYWVEFELGASNNNVDLHAVGMANNSANVNTYAGASTNGKNVFENSTRGQYGWDYNGSTTFIGTGFPQMVNGAVMCLYIDVVARKFFVYVHNGTTGSWIGDNPNTTPGGGFAFQFTGAAAPLYQSFHSGTNAKVRTVAQMTLQANAPGGATLGWDNAP